jgi:hypothetical protein
LYGFDLRTLLNVYVYFKYSTNGQTPNKFFHHVLPIETIYLVIPDECIDRPCSSTSTKESHETTISDEDVYQTQKEIKKVLINM